MKSLEKRYTSKKKKEKKKKSTIVENPRECPNPPNPSRILPTKPYYAASHKLSPEVYLTFDRKQPLCPCPITTSDRATLSLKALVLWTRGVDESAKGERSL